MSEEDVGVSIDEFLSLPDEKPEVAPSSEQIKALITNNPMTASQIAKAIGKHYSTVYSTLKRLLKKGEIVRKFRGNTPYYAYIPEE